MVLIPVLCLHCHSDHIIKSGTTKAGTQRYKCQNADCPHYSFQLELIYKAGVLRWARQRFDLFAFL